MTSRTTAVLIACLCTGLPAGQTPSQPRGNLLVLAKSDLTLSIVDPETRQVLGRVASGPDPHEVVASPDGRYAYISNYGGGSLNTITVVDLVERKPLPPINLGPLRGPHGLMFVAGRLWFTAEGAKVVGSYDPVAKEVDLVIGTGQNRTHMVFVSENPQRIITSNVSSATMSVLEKVTGGGRGSGGPPAGGANRGANPPAGPAGEAGRRGGPPGGGRGPGGPGRVDWEQTLIPVGRGAEGFDVSPDGKEIWTANAQDGTISVIDGAAKKVSETIAANVQGANRLKFTPDGKHVLVSALGGPDLTVFDTATRRETKRIKIGRGAAGIQMQPDGARAYVACTPDDYVAIIDLKSLEVVGCRIEAGRQPDGLAWAVRP
jgi:YVTN family beta-propeller protein